MNKKLLMASAAAEVGAGIALLATPHAIVGLLIDGAVDSAAALAVARLAGAALVTLGLVCWFGSRDAGSRAAAGIVAAMLFYNVAAVTIFLYVRMGLDLGGPGTWPAIVAHAALGVWCLACVKRGSA